ncbi:unnamed protein product [Pelagomonas calceolata]|uniref:Kazal-like domain-containing protein n=1 Tax=Pelagomonas calceolata TaxID=35677 RepID=A0A8J2WN80_9STRA|nr:unnamed protein product [Pelagomonas calceolata]|mmetsp:Transcript_23849/g.71369  ORF Transcript_23849/g.71369 Transcript_23849/m.71369 type:complete len:219 (-) Transcript_23849:259-915(-)
MESYGTIDERSAATPKKLVGRRIIAAVAAVALVVGASAAVSVNRLPGANLFMCPMIWAPVCGENGKTYGNACQAQGARMPFTDGECSPDAQAQTTPCTREFMPVCGSDGVEYVNKCYADKAGATYTEGPCTKPCTREYRPVCGLRTRTTSSAPMEAATRAILSRRDRSRAREGIAFRRASPRTVRSAAAAAAAPRPGPPRKVASRARTTRARSVAKGV